MLEGMENMDGLVRPLQRPMPNSTADLKGRGFGRTGRRGRLSVFRQRHGRVGLSCSVAAYYCEV